MRVASIIDTHLNRFTFPLPALWWIACLVLQVSLASHAPAGSSEYPAWLWLGSMWAGWSACLWSSSALQNAWARLALILAAGTWHVTWMWHVTWTPVQPADQRLLRYLIMFGGYAIAQAVLFRFFRVPSWSWAPFRLKPLSEGRRQFAILELLVLTTATALLIAGAKRHEPAAGQVFWIGLPIVCSSLAATATLCALAIVASTKGQRRLFAYGSLVIIAVGSLLSAWLEVTMVHPLPYMQAWLPYYAIYSAFAILIASFAACGRLFPIEPLHDRVFDVKTPDPPRSNDDASLPSSDLLPFRQPPHR